MAVETGTYISDLVVTNPAHTDGLGSADSHLRLLKATVKTTFPNITGAVTVTQAQLNSIATGVPQIAAGGCQIGVSAHDRFVCPALGVLDIQLADAGDTVAQTRIIVDGPHLLTTFYTAMTINGAVLVQGADVNVVGNTTVTGNVNSTLGFVGPGAVPIGGTLSWYSNVLPASGNYAFVNGDTVNRTGAPALFTLLGTRYGPGDGSTTFNLPPGTVVSTGENKIIRIY